MFNFKWKIAQSAEIIWWQNYLKKKDPQNYLTWKKEYWIDFLEKSSLIQPNNLRCLDAGCGPAGIFTVLNDNQVVAIDPLVNEYQSHLMRFFQKENYKYVEFQNNKLENIDLNLDPFDFVFCLNVINHVVDMKACLQKLWHLTKPGGNLIVSVDAHNYSFFKYLFRIIPADILHPHQYDLAEYVCLLKEITNKEIITINRKKEFFFDYYVLIVKK